MKRSLLFFCSLLFIAGCAKETEPFAEGTMRTISFQTEDDVTIVGNYWEGSTRAVLLLHMMPATKESWSPFAEDLAGNGFTVLAIDLRGHGESIHQDGKTLNYKTFTDAEHQASISDVDAAVQSLRDQGVEDISLVGASIGANLALQYQAEHPEIKKTILLSPGINYRGILAETFAQGLEEEQQVYFVAGSLDGRSAGNAAEMAKTIQSKIAGYTELKIYESSAHGTDLFKDDEGLIDILVQWLLE